MTLTDMGKRAKDISKILDTLGSREKSMGLGETARVLLDSEEEILTADKKDYDRAETGGMNQGLLDHLRLTPTRVQVMAGGLLQVTSLDDPMGEVSSMRLRPNGSQTGQKRIPPGVIGMIYEARPNVTTNVFSLCFKSGSAAILKGGSDALSSSRTIMEALRTGFSWMGFPEDSLRLIEDTSREITKELMRLNRYIDVLIPRDGAGFVRAVVENSTIPVIETRARNCHVYMDETADLQMALDTIFNAKTQRTSMCNACEFPLIHREVAERFLSMLKKHLDRKKTGIHGDEDVCTMVSGFVPATEEDWGREYLDCIPSPKIVDSVDKAISYVNTYSTDHSESIVTSDYFNAQKFLNEVDAAAVYVNASARLMDGNELGFGAEINISTQKLYARDPMGLEELTTTEYIIYRDGQIR